MRPPSSHPDTSATARAGNRRRRRGLPPIRTRPSCQLNVAGSTDSPKVPAMGVEELSGAGLMRAGSERRSGPVMRMGQSWQGGGAGLGELG